MLRLGLDPLVLVIGILARHNAYRSRAADRIARRVFRNAAKEVIQDLLRNLGVAERAAA